MFNKPMQCCDKCETLDGQMFAKTHAEFVLSDESIYVDEGRLIMKIKLHIGKRICSQNKLNMIIQTVGRIGTTEKETMGLQNYSCQKLKYHADCEYEDLYEFYFNITSHNILPYSSAVLDTNPSNGAGFLQGTVDRYELLLIAKKCNSNVYQFGLDVFNQVVACQIKMDKLPVFQKDDCQIVAVEPLSAEIKCPENFGHMIKDYDTNQQGVVCSSTDIMDPAENALNFEPNQPYNYATVRTVDLNDNLYVENNKLILKIQVTTNQINRCCDYSVSIISLIGTKNPTLRDFDLKSFKSVHLCDDRYEFYFDITLNFNLLPVTMYSIYCLNKPTLSGFYSAGHATGYNLHINNSSSCRDRLLKVYFGIEAVCLLKCIGTSDSLICDPICEPPRLTAVRYKNSDANGIIFL
jgi:hypothetical protein